MKNYLTNEELNAAIELYLSDSKRFVNSSNLGSIFSDNDKLKEQFSSIGEEFLNHIRREGPESMDYNVYRLLLSATCFGYLLRSTMLESGKEIQ